MAAPKQMKKRVVTSFGNLSAELQEEVKALYPTGYTEAMMRIDKPNGDFFYVVPFSTEEVEYLVKVDVKIDDQKESENEKEFYGSDEDDEKIAQADDQVDDDDM
ncbi:MAG: hypothetical protein SNH79_03310 [Rikenellaceae bacterium]